MNVELRELCKTIRGVSVLKNINLKLEDGKIYGLKGPNGSGKTMLMRIICGLIRATEGQVIVDGKIIGKDTDFPENTGILIENPAFISKFTGLKNLMMLASLQNVVGEQEVRDMLSDVGLEPDDKRTYRKYSLGMKQRLGIASALMEHPKLILLDEPINALDESGIKLVRDILIRRKCQGTLIIVACHDTEELEVLSDEVYEMSEGQIVNHYEVVKNHV